MRGGGGGEGGEKKKNKKKGEGRESERARGGLCLRWPL